jgi:hypothetical protein
VRTRVYVDLRIYDSIFATAVSLVFASVETCFLKKANWTERHCVQLRRAGISIDIKEGFIASIFSVEE